MGRETSMSGDHEKDKERDKEKDKEQKKGVLHFFTSFPRKGRKNITKIVDYASRGEYAACAYYIVSCLPYVWVLWVALLFATSMNLEFLLLLIILYINKELNKYLKSVLGHARPAKSSKKTHGMPSYHAQCSLLFATHATLRHNLFFSACPDNTTTIKALSPFEVCASHLFVSCGFFVCAVLVSCSRVALHMHSWDQVIVGGAVGVVIGILSVGCAQLVL